MITIQSGRGTYFRGQSVTFILWHCWNWLPDNARPFDSDLPAPSHETFKRMRTTHVMKKYPVGIHNAESEERIARGSFHASSAMRWLYLTWTTNLEKVRHRHSRSKLCWRHPLTLDAVYKHDATLNARVLAAQIGPRRNLTCMGSTWTWLDGSLEPYLVLETNFASGCKQFWSETSQIQVR